MQVTVRNNQWLGDIAIQESGSFETLFDLAVANEMSITADLKIGQQINLTKIDDKGIVEAFYKNEEFPASALRMANDEVQDDCAGGIGCWIIEDDFIVS